MTAPFFLLDESTGLSRFCIFHAARQRPPRGAVLFLPPLAEEMNKSRRMVAMQSRALSAAGYDVLLMDPLGCGDSGGDSADATWSRWVDDVLSAHRWLRERSSAPLWLWGLRAGALLACTAAERIGERTHFLFWQPAPQGRLLVQQFLRLKAAQQLGDGDAKRMIAAVRADLARGNPIEAAGYRFSAELLHGLERSELVLPADTGSVVWLEVSPREDATLLPASLGAIERGRAVAAEVRSGVARGPQFWQTVEIEDAPELLTLTLAEMERCGVAHGVAA